MNKKDFYRAQNIKKNAKPEVCIKQITAEDTWPLRNEIMWPEKQVEYVKLPQDKNGEHFGLFTNDVLISVVSLFIENGKAQFRKLATKNAHQGKGYGSQLLHFLLEQAEKRKIQCIWCNARIEKTNFYKKFGMLETDKRFNKGGLTYVIMQKDLIKPKVTTG